MNSPAGRWNADGGGPPNARGGAIVVMERRVRHHDGELVRGIDGTVRVHTPAYVVDYPASTKSLFEDYSSDPRFRSMVRYLDRIAQPSISRLEILALSKLVHDCLTYAFHFRHQGRRFATSPSQYRRQAKPLQELKRLRKAAVRRDFARIRSIMCDLSDECLTLITGCDEHPVLEAVIPEVLINSIDRVIADPRMYCRPERRELDRAAATLVGVFERVTGLDAKLANHPVRERPCSKIHDFTLRVGDMYKVALVTPASDDRLAKVLSPDFKFEVTFPSPRSDQLGWG